MNSIEFKGHSMTRCERFGVFAALFYVIVRVIPLGEHKMLCV